jgi:cytoskeletal protein CcmA (bactofilin family)
MSLREMRDGEDGVALVTAILASAVVLILSVSAVSLAIHNTQSSGFDRRRLQAVGAAEAGIDQYYAILNTTAFTSAGLQAVSGMDSSCRLTRTLSTTPTTTFTVTPTFATDNAGSNASACPTPAFLSLLPSGPWYVTLTSVGNVAGLAPYRTLQSKARLSNTGSGIVFPAAAMVGHTGLNLSANVQVYGNGGDNADLYTDNYIAVTTQSNIKGNIYAQGTATISNGNFQVAGSVWAKNAVSIGGGRVGTDVISSTSTVSVSGNTRVYGNAKAASTITVLSPAQILGTQSPNTSGIGDPPSLTYPTYNSTTFNNYGSADFPGYVNQGSCSGAQTAINNWTSGNLYIRLTGCTTFNPPSISSMPGNLAILTDGGITMTTGTKFMTTGNTSRAVYLFTGMTGTCGNFTAQSNTGFGPNLKVLLYTPQSCSVTIQSNSFNASGQIFSGTITFSSNTSFTYAPVPLPTETAGASGVLVDVVYKREVAS